MNDPGILVAPEWLAEHLDDPDVVVADVRWSPVGGTPAAEAAFAQGHIPGAVFLDVDRDLAARAFVDGPGRHPLPTPGAFAATLGAAGIGDGDLVVCSDDVRGSVAGRLWWMLDGTGRRAALLDGGVPAWTGPLETGPGARRTPAAFEARPWPPGRVVDAHDVARALESGILVLDARAAERYRGDVEPIHPVAGHIPGARSAPWDRNVNPDTGRFLDPESLRSLYGRLGVRDAAGAIAACGSGVTTCHDLFAMRLAGLGDAHLYQGSWSDWVHDRSRPVATGPDPG